MVVDWVPNRERRPAGRVSFAQTGRRSRPRQARTVPVQVQLRLSTRTTRTSIHGVIVLVP